MDENGQNQESLNPTGGVEILFGQFTQLSPEEAGGRAMSITVAGQNILDRAVPFFARVGDQPVLGLVVSPGGSGFSGFLERLPRSGDRLFVRYADFEEIATGVIYQAPGVA